jgi:CheY-like chemotaxis protein
VARRIVLITPGERHGLAALKDAGFTGYLVKPVRAASLKVRLAAAGDGFEMPAAASQAGASSARSGVSNGDIRSLAILIAEDNEINALLARTLLAKLGHRPTVAASGAAALENWRAARESCTPFDLVLMDVHMPGIDGLEATRRIRALEAEQHDPPTPIVALTANAFSEDRDACLAAGMNGFLVKPLDRERLAAALDALPDRASIAA